MRSLCTQLERSPLLATAREKLVQSEDPAQPKIINKIKKKQNILFKRIIAKALKKMLEVGGEGKDGKIPDI